MARELTEYGFEIVAITTVGDNAQMIEHAPEYGFGRADVLLLTGGVGPTKDDITKIPSVGISIPNLYSTKRC